MLLMCSDAHAQQALMQPFNYDPVAGKAVMPSGAVGIGTTAPVGSSSLTVAGHLGWYGTAPVASTCGSGTVAAGSTDNKGSITGITAATACTLTFNAALPTLPTCVFSTSTGIAVGISSISTTAVTTTMAALTGTLYYLCF